MSLKYLQEPLVSFQEHHAQSLEERKKQRKNNVVAPALEKFVNIRTWPRSGKPLPEDVENGVKQKNFSWAALALPICLLAVSVALVPAALILGFIPDFVQQDGIRLPGILFAAVVLGIGLCCLSASLCRNGFLVQHVAALHLCYVDSQLPLSEARQEVFTTLQRQSLCKIYLNGDIEIMDVQVCPSTPPPPPSCSRVPSCVSGPFQLEQKYSLFMHGCAT